MADWSILGEQGGFRRKEWAQDRIHLSKNIDFQRNVDGSVAAFIIKDMEFGAYKNKRINNKSITEIKKEKIVNLKQVAQSEESKEWSSHFLCQRPQVQKYCFIESSLRIHKRAKQLSVKKDNPIAVFTEIKKGKKKTHYI